MKVDDWLGGSFDSSKNFDENLPIYLKWPSDKKLQELGSGMI